MIEKLTDSQSDTPKKFAFYLIASKIFQVCDSNLMILAVNPRHGGRTHDAFIWRFSTLQQELRRVVTVEGEEYCWLIG